MISWNNEFNQIEQTIKRLKEHKNSKTIAMQIYDPKSDGRKTMSGMPCLLSIDLKTLDTLMNRFKTFFSEPLIHDIPRLLQIFSILLSDSLVVVATTILSIKLHFLTLCMRNSNNETPPSSARTLPGRRVDSTLAWSTAK